MELYSMYSVIQLVSWMESYPMLFSYPTWSAEWKYIPYHLVIQRCQLYGIIFHISYSAWSAVLNYIPCIELSKCSAVWNHIPYHSVIQPGQLYGIIFHVSYPTWSAVWDYIPCKLSNWSAVWNYIPCKLFNLVSCMELYSM